MRCKASVKTKICVGCEHNKEHEYNEECSVKCKAHFDHSKCAHKVSKN